MVQTNPFKYNVSEKIIVAIRPYENVRLFEDEYDVIDQVEVSNIVAEGLTNAGLKIISQTGEGFDKVTKKDGLIYLEMRCVIEHKLVVKYYPSNNYYEPDDWEYIIDDNDSSLFISSSECGTSQEIVDAIQKAAKESRRFKDCIQEVVSVSTDIELIERLLDDERFNDLVKQLL